MTFRVRRRGIDSQVRAHYRISRDPSRNAVLGSSYGGLAAALHGFVHPSGLGT